MKSEYTSAAQFVNRISQKYSVKKNWVWDLLSDEFNIIKGLGCLVSRE